MTTTVPQQRRTRKPTGLPSWPMLLLAGAEKSGKSWSCAVASGSDLVGATYWIGIGEDDPDEYGNIPGARFEIVEHDGTYRDILAAIDWVTAQPAVDGKPNLLVVDSMTRLWELLCDMAQSAAVARQKRKTSNGNRPVPDDEVQITMDLWNNAKDRWAHVIDCLRSHTGPVLLTARLEEVTVMVNGKPSGDKTLKVKAEKSLPYDVGGIVQMPERGRAYLTGVRTTRMQIPERVPLPGFTVEKLWRDLGLADTELGERHHQGVNPADAASVQTAPVQAVAPANPNAALINEVAVAAEAAGVSKDQILKDWADAHRGQHIKDAKDVGALELLRDDLLSRAKEKVA